MNSGSGKGAEKKSDGFGKLKCQTKAMKKSPGSLAPHPLPKAQDTMSILSSNRTRSTLAAVAPLLAERTLAALKAARHDPLSTRAGHVPFEGLNFVADTPTLPVSDASFERVLTEEFRDGVRLQFERRRGDRVLNIDLVMRQSWAFTWMRGYTIAGTASRDFYFVPQYGVGPVIEIRSGALQRCARGFGDRDRVLGLEAGERFLASLIAGR